MLIPFPPPNSFYLVHNVLSEKQEKPTSLLIDLHMLAKSLNFVNKKIPNVSEWVKCIRRYINTHLHILTYKQ